MGFLNDILEGINKFAQSDTAKRIMERSQQLQAEKIAKSTGINGLKCVLTKSSRIGSHVTSEGYIENTGISTYSQVVVLVTFRNDNNQVVDKQTKYAVLADNFCPGESRPFRVFSSAQNIKSADAVISEFKEN